MEIVQAYIMSNLMFWLCEMIEPEESEKLGIWDNDPPFDLVDIQANFQIPEWKEARLYICNSFGDERTLGSDQDKKIRKQLTGPYEVCRLYICKPRDASKRLLEL